MGDGWSAENKRVTFTIRGYNSSTLDEDYGDVVVSVFTSDKAQFFTNGELPLWLPPACMSPGHIPSSVVCDWDRLFHVDADDPLLSRTQHVVTIEMLQHTRHEDIFDENEIVDYTLKLTVDFVAFLNFTTYQLDPSPLTNPMYFVQALDLPRSGEVIKIDPAWVLAAWSVDNGSYLDPDRVATVEMLRTVNDGYSATNASLDYRALIPVIQTLSLIDFTTENFSDLSSTSDVRHPILTRNARLRLGVRVQQPHSKAWAGSGHCRHRSGSGALCARLHRSAQTQVADTTTRGGSGTPAFQRVQRHGRQ